MEVHAYCRLDYNAYKEINREHTRVRRIVCILATAYLLFRTLIEWAGYSLGESVEIALPLALTFVTALWAFFFVNIITLAPRSMYGSNKWIKNAEYFFTFRQDDMSVVARSNLVDSSTNVKYEAIFRVIETSKYFLIYISNSQAYIVDKSTVCDGTDGDIRNTLLAALGSKKYKLRLKAAK